MNNLKRIIKSGYLKSREQLEKENVKLSPNMCLDPSVIYSKLHFKDVEFVNQYGKFCLVLNKDILKNRNDHSHHKHKYYLKYGTDVDVVFKTKISLKKYLVGVLFQYDYCRRRPDLAYYLTYNKYKIFNADDEQEEYEKYRDIFKFLEDRNIPIFFVNRYANRKEIENMIKSLSI